MNKPKILRDLLAERDYYARMRDHVIALAQMRASFTFDLCAQVIQRLTKKGGT